MTPESEDCRNKPFVTLPNPNGPFGAKGLGECAMIPTAPAILNAIADAPGARITALHVVEVPAATPLGAEDRALDAPAEAVERAVKKLARKHRGVKIAVRLLRARHAGKAIADELKEGKFDLAVMSYHHKRSLAELLLGTTASYLAKHAPCRLLMSVPPRR